MSIRGFGDDLTKFQDDTFNRQEYWLEGRSQTRFLSCEDRSYTLLLICAEIAGTSVRIHVMNVEIKEKDVAFGIHVVIVSYISGVYVFYFNAE